MPSSALEQYTMNYGQRLESLLTPQVKHVTDTSEVVGRPTAPQETSALAPQIPEPQMQQPQGPTPDQQFMADEDARNAAENSGEPPASALAAPGLPKPTSALENPQAPKRKGENTADLFHKLSPDEQEQQQRNLADALKRGGKTIDEAYDELIKQMGTRPDENLSKKDKSMLLMEFGLNLMAQSAKTRHGGDLTGALGDAGINSMDSYQRAKGAKARAWDERRSALDTGRVKDKLDQSMLATTQEIKSDAMLPHEFAPQRDQISSFPGGDGFMYKMVNGVATKLLDEQGNPIKATDKDVHGGPSGGAEKTFEFDHRLKSYMKARGYDADGEPISEDVPKLTGPQKRKLLAQATDYAGDTKNAALSDEEITQQAQRAVDDQLRFQQDHYRDLTPDQLEAERARLVTERVKEIKAGRTSALETPPPDPNRGPLAAPTTPGSPFESNPIPKAPPASVLAVGKIRKIKGFEGRWTLKNGLPVRVD